MERLVCKKTLKGVDVEHIALNVEGEPVVLCAVMSVMRRFVYFSRR